MYVCEINNLICIIDGNGSQHLSMECNRSTITSTCVCVSQNIKISHHLLRYVYNMQGKKKKKKEKTAHDVGGAW